VVPGEGTWTVDPTGQVTFTPEVGFTGDPTPIDYNVTDSTGQVSNDATITINYPQSAPTAVNDAVSNPTVGTPTTLPTVANDADAENDIDPTTVTLTDPAATDTDADGDADTLVVAGEGTWTVDPVTGDITFTPEAGFLGDPSPIDYNVTDTTGQVSNDATETVDYPQTAPVAVDDSEIGVSGTPTNVDILGNDTDPENNIDPTTVNFTDPAATDSDGDGDNDTLVVPGEGTWTVDPTGQVTFTPEASFTDDPTPIDYNVTDTTGQVSNDATITIN
jgi:CshA-type fibril repeat protein